MKVRFGFVAMSVQLEDASPSGNVTAKQAEILKPADRRLKCKRTAERDFIGDLSPLLSAIGRFVRQNGMRVSFHPEHFSVLTSEDEAVAEATRNILGYHVRLVEGMGLGRDVKLVLHLGGAGRDRTAAIRRAALFIKGLPEKVSGRMVLENDDKVFTALDVLSCAEPAGLPVVLDVHHEKCNPSGEPLPVGVRRCRRAGFRRDSRSQAEGRRRFETKGRYRGDAGRGPIRRLVS